MMLGIPNCLHLNDGYGDRGVVPGQGIDSRKQRLWTPRPDSVTLSLLVI